ncbi:MAG: alkaline phosphatase family protein [Candidatus Cybelea sp.]
MRALCLALTICGAALAVSGCGGGGAGAPPVSTNASAPPPRHPKGQPIKHIVLMIQENRTFNNLFAGFPGAVSTTTGKELVKSGTGYVPQQVPLAETNLLAKGNLNHRYVAYQTAYQNGAMDGFNLIKYGTNGKPENLAPYQYVNPAKIAPYRTIAAQWGLADNFFQTQGSGSFIAHQDLIRGGTAINTTESLIDDPTTNAAWGCFSPAGAKTSLITTDLQYEADKGPFPCTTNFPYPNQYLTLGDLMNAKNVQWKYYTPAQTKGTVGALWNAYLVIASICNAQGKCSPNISSPESSIFSDISNGTLPPMSWVIPDAPNSDHPGYSSKDTGPSWVASVVNAIGESQYWNTTAIVVVWDDWGGFYDPVPPPFQDDQGGAGFRVPMLVISPYVKTGSGSHGGYISHTLYGFGSIVRFIEDNWKLGRLGTTDQSSASIANMFNYKQSPRGFKKISSPYDERYFLRQKPSGLPVDTE